MMVRRVESLWSGNFDRKEKKSEEVRAKNGTENSEERQEGNLLFHVITGLVNNTGVGGFSRRRGEEGTEKGRTLSTMRPSKMRSIYRFKSRTPMQPEGNLIRKLVGGERMGEKEKRNERSNRKPKARFRLTQDKPEMQTGSRKAK